MTKDIFLTIGAKINPYLSSLLKVKELNREGKPDGVFSWYKAEFHERYIAETRQLEAEVNIVFFAVHNLEAIAELETERIKERINSRLSLGIVPEISCKDHIFTGGSGKLITLIYQLTEEQQNTLYLLGKLNKE